MGSFENCYTENVPLNVQPQSMQISALGEVSDWDISSTPNLTLVPIELNSINLPECGGVVDTEEKASEPIKLQLFPNPTTGRANISGDLEGIHSYQMVNLLGEVVAKERLITNYIDLQQFAPGVYSILFLDEHGGWLSTMKVCKQ